jgi:hypothetical protein
MISPVQKQPSSDTAVSATGDKSESQHNAGRGLPTGEVSGMVNGDPLAPHSLGGLPSPLDVYRSRHSAGPLELDPLSPRVASQLAPLSGLR